MHVVSEGYACTETVKITFCVRLRFFIPLNNLWKLMSVYKYLKLDLASTPSPLPLKKKKKTTGIRRVRGDGCVEHLGIHLDVACGGLHQPWCGRALGGVGHSALPACPGPHGLPAGLGLVLLFQEESRRLGGRGRSYHGGCKCRFLDFSYS